MPAHCADGYDIYCAWCVEHHRPPPSRDWWDHACREPRAYRPLNDDEFDIETEQREGWAP